MFGGQSGTSLCKGTEWYLEKRIPEIFGLILKSRKHFLTGVKVLFSGDFGVLKAHYFFLVNGSQSLRFVVFLFPFGLWESNFSLFVGTELIKLS